MIKHTVGNQYELLLHVVELQKISGHSRCILACGPGCCTSRGLMVECDIAELNALKCIKEVDSKYHPPCKSEIDWQKGDTAQVKDGWDRAGTEFVVLGPAVFLGQWWVPIEDPDEEDPDFFKEAGLRKVVVNEE